MLIFMTQVGTFKDNDCRTIDRGEVLIIKNLIIFITNFIDITLSSINNNNYRRNNTLLKNSPTFKNNNNSIGTTQNNNNIN